MDLRKLYCQVAGNPPNTNEQRFRRDVARVLRNQGNLAQFGMVLQTRIAQLG
jgi:hypothetical protein